MKTYFFLLYIGLISLLIFGCELESTAASEEQDTGSGSEVVGVVKDDGNQQSALIKKGADILVPVVAGNIYLYKENFEATPNQHYAPNVTTDANGRFRIFPVYNGTYILEANNGKGESIAKKIIVNGQPSVDAGSFLVQLSSSLKYTIKTGLNTDANFKYSIHLLGTRIASEGTGKKLSFQLGGIPSGTLITARIKVQEPFEWSETFSRLNFRPGSIVNLDIEVPEINLSLPKTGLQKN